MAKQDTLIVCTQCKARLYKGVSQEISSGHGQMKWVPVVHGSRTPPAQPPKRCPYCEGSTIQEGIHHAI